MSIYKDSVQQDHKPVEIGGSRFIFRNDRLHELRPMKQPGGRGDFRSSIGKLEYDQACRAIHDKSVELHNQGLSRFAASCLPDVISKAKLHSVVRFLVEKDLLIRNIYERHRYEVKNPDTFCQECESLWETLFSSVQENENNWQKYLQYRESVSKQQKKYKRGYVSFNYEYDLLRMSHFIDKLELLVDNCPTSERQEHADTMRVSLPHFQTKDAIEQLKTHIQKLIEAEQKIKEQETD